MPEYTAQQNKKNLEQVLKNQYNLSNPNYFASILAGVSYIYLVESEGKKYFVKHIKSKFDQNHITHVSTLINYLTEKGIYIPKVYKNKNDHYYTEFADSNIQVQEYIEGSTFINNNVPHNVIFFAPKILSTVNTYLNDLKSLPFKLKTDHLENVDIAYYTKKFETLIADTKKNISETDKQKNKILKDLEYKLNNLHHFKDLNINKSKITFVNTHGDFHPKQLLVHNNKVYIVDFDTFCTQPATFDLLHFYFQVSSFSKWGEINKEELGDFIKVYMKDIKLLPYDIEKMLKIYARKIIRGSFGYKNYIYNIGSNRLEHLNFGFWKTSLVKNLFLQNDEIVSYLLDELF